MDEPDMPCLAAEARALPDAAEWAERTGVVERAGAVVRGAGGSWVRLTTGFGNIFTIFLGFGFGFAFGAVINTASGFCAGGSSGTAIVSGGSTSSGWASVICGPGVMSTTDSDADATSKGSSAISTAGAPNPGSPPPAYGSANR